MFTKILLFVLFEAKVTHQVDGGRFVSTSNPGIGGLPSYTAAGILPPRYLVLGARASFGSAETMLPGSSSPSILEDFKAY